MALLAQTEWEDRPRQREAEWGSIPVMPDLVAAEALLLQLASVFAASSSSASGQIPPSDEAHA